MKEYIPKVTVVAEIKKRIKEIEEIGTYLSPKGTLTNLLCYINSLEVKEVDLEQEIQQHINDCLDIKFPTTDIKMIAKDVEYTARKFFELGLKAKGAEGICKTSETEYPNFDEAQGTPITK